jgi:tRNA/tmRNA/rRNA uracil-C5-methylase (TrmA/RlmC/RlmD family)
MNEKHEEPTILRVERLVQGGAALLRSDRGIIFVEGALPGEVIEIGPTRRRAGRLEAEVLRIVEPSPERREPPCPLFGECGGCDWQHLSYAAQLHWKTEILRENFRRIGGITLDPEAVTIVSGPEFSYRSRVQIHREESAGPDGAAVTGFRRRRSREIVPVVACPVATGRINDELARLTFEPPGKPRTVMVESSDGVARSDRDREATILIGEVPFRFDPAGFAQANQRLLPDLAAAMRSAVGEATTLIDLYAGAGLLAMMAGGSTTRVICVEPDRRNARFIRDNLSRAGVATVTVVPHTAERAIRSREIGGIRWSETTVLLDPPRGGISPAVRAWLTAGDAPFQRVAYLSCDAAALARDLRDLSGSYRIAATTIFDFYPQTAHIETLVTLEGTGGTEG